MSNRKEIYNRVLKAANKEELRKIYSDWADAIEQEGSRCEVCVYQVA